MDFYLHIIVLFGTFLPSVLGYNLVFGKGKILHFGPFAVSLFVGYCVAIILKTTGSFPLAIVVALVGSVLFSLFFAWLALRLEPDGLGVMSIAVHLSVLAVALNWNSLTRGALGIPQIPRLSFLNSVSGFAVLSVIICVISFLIFWFVDKSKFGRQLEALAEHEWHAKSLGINRVKVYVWAFVLLGFAIVVSNVFFLQYLTLLHPNDYMFPALVLWVMIVVAGKPGSVVGVTVATILLVILKEALRFVPLAPALVGPVRLILFGLILYIAVWIRRDTVFPQERKV